MFKHIIIGQYLPGNSFLHRMDARAKLIAVLLMIMVIFLADTWRGYGAVTVGTVGVWMISGVPLRYILKGMYPIFILIVGTFLLHAFLTQEGEVIATVGAFSVYSGGIEQGLFIGLRLFFLVLVTSLLTLTTSPIDLTDGLEQMLQPLKRFGVPAHEVALMMSIAIRFIPTLFQEAEKIIKAQTARGAKFNSGSMKQRTQAMISLLVPLFIRAFKRAEDLALAMEARGYNGGEKRTKLRALTWRRKDTIACLIVAVSAVLLFFFQR